MQKNVVTVRFFVIGGAIRVGVDCNKKHSKLNYNTDTLIFIKELVGILNQVTIALFAQFFTKWGPFWVPRFL